MIETKTTTIKASSRCSFKIGESYYTFESTIEKSVSGDYTDEEYNDAKRKLWDEANADVDTQLEETLEFLKKKR